MSDSVVLAIPSKGRLKEQVEGWLADCGFSLRAIGGPRGYAGLLDGVDGVEVRLASAAEIAQALADGEAHLGVTGEDLLREQGSARLARIRLLRALGFGRADLVVAAPRSWIDVETMADVDEVAHAFVARTGRRLRVATKYLAQSREFFALHGIADYRLFESTGATEGAPAAGAAELVVDITTSGATLAANGLKPLADGLILRSEAQLAASLEAAWSQAALLATRRLLTVVEARARARALVRLTWPREQDDLATSILAAKGCDSLGPFGGALVGRTQLFGAATALSEAGVGPLVVEEPRFVFESACSGADLLESAVASAQASD